MTTEEQLELAIKTLETVQEVRSCFCPDNKSKTCYLCQVDTALNLIREARLKNLKGE